MNESIFINILIFGFILLFVFQRFITRKGMKQITTTELKRELEDKKKQFIDVRTPSEFRTKHIKGFQNMPLAELRQQSHHLSKEREVFVICQSGMRSAKGSRLLTKLGFKRVTNIKGGMNTWI
ncbi:rhodanese-like domain-containing protein [Priestia filamentosa]|uniref:rhodanese-like domain-containing protein n=1 Tax=Priestia filamentosa TaxID=1402861 RepID=UPI001FB4F60B|nr:rhodanese-like domain-containing protein [Priestia filamentosa]UOE58325.1 rhodanese-like domain-containing protein [Priestia filamentosa]